MRSVSTRFVGLLLVALGVWGGLIPFVGHYFHFALGPDKSWEWTSGRFYLDVLPAVATILGGLNLMSAGPRHSARLGALLALAGGIWFTIGPEISQLWHAGGAQGAGHGSPHRQMLEMLTYHTGLGVVVAALAAYALPRFPVIEEVAAPADGRMAAAGGAGAGAGALAGSRGGRWYHEPGALDEPAGQHERAAAAGAGTRTHEHPVADEAAVGAGAAGAGALAEHHHRERVAARERGAEERGAEEETGRAPEAERTAGAGEPPAEETGRGEPGVAGAAEREREGVTDEQSAPAEATAETRVHDGAAADTTGAGTGAAAPQTAATTDYSGHSTVRRRRGGLLSSLLRR